VSANPPASLSARLRDFLDQHLFAFLMLLLVLYLLFLLPQVSTIWMDLPFDLLVGREFLLALAFILLVAFLIVFFTTAWISAYPPGPPAAVPSGYLGKLWRLLCWLTDRLAGWPAALTGRLGRGQCRWLGTVLLALAAGNFLTRLWIGPADGGRLYPLAASTWILFGWLLLFTALWFLAEPASGGRGPVGVMVGRALGLIWVTNLIGEATWIAADFVPSLISYRVYTIGAVFHVCFLLLVAAGLVDVAHETWGFPVRQVVTFGLAVFVLFCLSPSDVAGPRAQFREPLEEDCKPKVSEPDWYDHLLRRIQATDPRGPVVFVAASGGGSRAAVFTALCLEYLKRERLQDSEGADLSHPDGTPVAWADQIVLLSSVSGGSLATAYHVHGLMNGWPRDRVGPRPLNSFKDGLARGFDFEIPDRWAFYRQMWRTDSRYFDDKNLQHCEYLRLVEQLPQAHPGLPRETWAAFVDDMNTDFMAPLCRALLTPGVSLPSSWRNRAFAPTLERGTSLCRFWEQRFGWSGCNTLDGYGEKVRYGDEKRPAPLVLFNVTRAREGTRFVIGFPPLPRGSLRVKPTGDNPNARPPDRDSATETLTDFWPRYQLSLGEAVRLSANFPWGVHTGRLWKEIVTLSPSARSALENRGDKGRQQREKVHKLLTAGACKAQLQVLLDDEQFLPEQLAGDGSEQTAADAVERIARRLEELRWDPRVLPGQRKQAEELLNLLEKEAGPLIQAPVNLDLLDGGVNDNTGLPTLWEVVQHLHDLESCRDQAPLTGLQPRERACRILRELRRRGVVLVEIDSGAKPHLDAVPEVRVPAQALENAGYASAYSSHDWYLQRLQALLGDGALGDGAADGTPQVRLGPLFVWTFTCNHSRPDDVLTAWALAPAQKARVLATFACECVEWEQLERPLTFKPWLIEWEKAKGLRNNSDPNVPPVPLPPGGNDRNQRKRSQSP
jgi:hypothetical protein